MANLTGAQALGEMMAAVASQASSEAEAEAMMGAAVMSSLTARERAELEAVLANLVRGTAVLARVLWRYPITRPAIRMVPSIVRGTGQTLVRQAGAGRPVTPQQAGRVMAAQTRRVLGQPRVAQQALRTNARGTVVAARRTRPMVRPARPGRRMAPRGRPVGRRPMPYGARPAAAPRRRPAPRPSRVTPRGARVAQQRRVPTAAARPVRPSPPRMDGRRAPAPGARPVRRRPPTVR
jgi:hypothetical protein